MAHAPDPDSPLRDAERRRLRLPHRGLVALAWIAALAVASLWAPPVWESDYRDAILIGVGWFFPAAVLAVAPALTFSTCWAEERARGTLEALALSPFPRATLHRIRVRARILPWLVPTLLAFGLAWWHGAGLAQGDVDSVVRLLLGAALYLALAYYSCAVAVWAAAAYANSALAVAVALGVTLSGEVAVFLGAVAAQAVLRIRGGRLVPSLLLAAIPIAAQVLYAAYLQGNARRRVERLLDGE